MSIINFFRSLTVWGKVTSSEGADLESVTEVDILQFEQEPATDNSAKILGINASNQIVCIDSLPGGGGGNVSALSETVLVQNGQTITFAATPEKFISSFYTHSDPGPEITAVGTIDTDNVSTLDARLIDNNLTNIVYNNSSPGQNNIALPGVDIDAAQPISQVKLWWYNLTYNSGDFNIQGSVDGSTWINITNSLSSENVLYQEISIPDNTPFRYYRVFSNVGLNPNYVVLTEMKVSSVSPNSRQVSTDQEQGIIIEFSGSNIQVKNESGSDREVTIYYLP